MQKGTGQKVLISEGAVEGLGLYNDGKQLGRFKNTRVTPEVCHSSGSTWRAGGNGHPVGTREKVLRWPRKLMQSAGRRSC